MKTKKTVCFVLPGTPDVSMGGFKVVYEYANRLCENGYKVTILYNRISCLYSTRLDFLRFNYQFLLYLIKLIKADYKVKWFALNEKINEKYFFRYTKNVFRKYNTIVATAVDTAFGVRKVNAEKSKNVMYLIQDFEAWNSYTSEDCYNSYKFDFKKIVIAPWLKDKVAEVEKDSFLIPNGFDFEYFKLTNPIEKRNPYTICMLNHNDDRKRCQDSFEALKIVKEKFPQLKVNIFGTPERPENLPDWYNYYQRPDQENHNFIYNNSSIFIAASKAEGMALPPAEAMICGCALVCTNIPGFALYAKNNETALLSPVFNPEKLACNIIKLIENQDLRIKLAKAGNEFIKQFTWQKASQKFIEVLEKK